MQNGERMPQDKSFWKAKDEDVESVQAFLTSRTGLILSSVIVAGMVVAIVWAIVEGVFA